MDEKEDIECRIDKECMRTFRYSPSHLNDLKEIFDIYYTAIESYKETSMSSSEEAKQIIKIILFEAEKTFMNITELLLISNSFIDQAKEKIYFSKEVKLDESQIKYFSELLQKTEGQMKELISKTRQYITAVENQEIM